MEIDDPLLHHPNMFAEPDEPTGLYCFKDKERVCGPDCMAFSEPPNHKDFIGKQWANCLILVNYHRVGKHATILAQAADSLLKMRQDEVRLNPSRPEPPR